MWSLFIQSILAFFLSALVVILVTIVAEKYGTKIGGILGTLPSTIIIAFVFIGLDQGITTASKSVAVVPAGMAINLLFLVCFAVLSYRSLFLAILGSFSLWTLCAILLYIYDITNIWLSLVVFILSFLCTFVFFEYVKKTRSASNVKVKYTAIKIMFRGVIAGIVIAISVILSTTSPVLSGIFSIFPAIFFSTMLISVREHGSDFAAGIAKSMIYGSPSVVSYACAIHFLYPIYGILVGSIIAFFSSVGITLILYLFRTRIK
jgi:hypothetical protein